MSLTYWPRHKQNLPFCQQSQLSNMVDPFMHIILDFASRATNSLFPRGIFVLLWSGEYIEDHTYHIARELFNVTSDSSSHEKKNTENTELLNKLN